MDELNPYHDITEPTSAEMTELIVSRFPNFKKHILEAFHYSSLFRDLCEDYYLIETRQSELSSNHMSDENSAGIILHNLKRELEQEMFNYFKSFKR